MTNNYCHNTTFTDEKCGSLRNVQFFLAGKAGMVHSVSGCAWGVQVKLRDPLRTCAMLFP